MFSIHNVDGLSLRGRFTLKSGQARGPKYFLLAVVDVEANYLVLRAYQYTSVTSVQLKTSTHQSSLVKDKSTHQSSSVKDKYTYQSSSVKDKSTHQSSLVKDKSTHQSSLFKDKSTHQSSLVKDKSTHQSSSVKNKSTHQSSLVKDKSTHQSSLVKDKSTHQSSSVEETTLLHGKSVPKFNPLQIRSLKANRITCQTLRVENEAKVAIRIGENFRNLLDCFVVPVVLALSWLFLKVRYKLVHVLGVGLCLLGVGCLVWANVEDGKAAIPGSERLLGDMLCLGGATLYGLSNVAQEYVIKTYDGVEFLGMIGLFGSLINGVQLGEVGSVRWDTWPVLALVGGFSAAQFMFYVVAVHVIKATSATALNLALFTADFYILITGIALFRFKEFIVFVIKPTPISSSNRGYYREISVGRSGSGHEVELTTTPGTATSSVGGTSSFTDWPPLPPEIRGCPDYPYPHSHTSDYSRNQQDYPTTPPSPPQQFRSLPRPSRREHYPGGGSSRAATLHRPARFHRANGASSPSHELGDVRC
ncbi:Solute carrier family 35 member F1 [Armadillidium vulgare]|nr:Solute carrier family 35 member F1 [Armadillidium vulgare]